MSTEPRPDGGVAVSIADNGPGIAPEHQERIFSDHLKLSVTDPDGRESGLAGISHVIWPEAAMPFLPPRYHRG